MFIYDVRAMEAEEGIGFLELGLQVVESHHVGTENLYPLEEQLVL